VWGPRSAHAAWTPVVLRAALGAVMLAHGSQKLFGWFGGHGMAATAGFLGGLGFNPPMLWTVLLVLAEFGGGLLLIVGFLVPYAAAAIVTSQLVAVATVHWGSGFFNSHQGFEFNLTLIALGVALMLTGAGPLSVDALFGRRQGERQ